MAKRITLKDVKHVDFVPGDFLAEFALNPDWNAEDIGCYFTICLHLYCQGGKLVLDIPRLAKICRIKPSRFVKVWEKIRIKFVKACSQVEKNGFEFESKRVRKELRAARSRMQKASNAGLIGATARWQPHATANTKRNETKRNKTNKTKRNETNEQPSSSLKNSPSFSLRFAEKLEKAINPRTESDKMALVNLIHWLRNQQSDNRTYDKVLKYAKDAKTGRNPMAVFFATLKRELGYRLNR